jgi:hypothetical protein
MAERRWSFVVQDARGRRHRGAVTWGAGVEAASARPEPPAEFHIGLLSQPADVTDAPLRTAICVPGVPRLRALRPGEDVILPRKIAELSLAPHKMAEYAAGSIVMAVDGLIEPEDVFVAHSEHPRLDRLALILIEAAAVEATAPYVAVIRHELALSPGADALAALGERLLPEDPEQRPPSRAPGVLRLARALRRLRDGRSPSDSLERITEDLRFLRVFDKDAPALKGDALDRLLDDVRHEPEPKPRRTPAKIVPLRRKRDDA